MQITDYTQFRSVVSREKVLATSTLPFNTRGKKRGNLLDTIASYFLQIGLLFEV